jgi:O-antigen/teichoic acid export membrane protein
MKPLGPDQHDHSGDSSGGPDLIGRLTGEFARDTLRYIPAAVLPAGLSIVSASIFTRIFLPEEYGRYALVIAATNVVTAILSGWMRQSVLRYLPRFKAEGRLPEFLTKLVVVLLGVSIVTVAALLLFRSAVTQLLGVYGVFLVPAVLLILSETFFSNFGAVFQANLKSKSYSVFKISNAALRLGLALAYILLIERNVVGIILGGVVANLLLLGPMMRALDVLRNLGAFHRFIDVGFVKLFAAYGLPMVGWILCSQILELSDRFILGALRGSAEVGIYSANYNLVRMGFGLVSGPILTALYPLVMTTWENGHREKTTDVITQFSRHYLLAIMPLITFVGLFARDIVAIVLGSEFREGYTIVPFVLGGAAAWGLAMIGHKGLEISERTRTMLLLVAVSAIVNIVLNFVFIPRYGYDGAALATFVGYLVYPALVYWAARRLIPWRIPWLSLGRIVVACAVMGGSTLAVGRLLPESTPVPVALVVSAVVGLAVYAGVLIAIRELGVRDIRARLDR